MRRFAYEAVGDTGTLVKGVLEASDEAALAETLERQGLVLVRMRFFASLGGARRERQPRRAKPQDVAELAKYIAITTRAGLPIVDSIRQYAEDARTPDMRTMLQQVARDINNGSTLAEAFARYPRSFDQMFLSMVRAGEASGTIEQAMVKVAEQISFQSDVRGQMKAALIPPAVLLTAVAGLVVLLLTFLLPRIIGMLVDSDIELPLPTRILIGISDFLIGNAVLLGFGLVGGIMGMKAALRTDRGRMLFTRAILKLPALGAVIRQGAEARFVSSMRTLLQSGVDAVSALEMSADATGCPPMTLQIRAAIVRTKNGETLAAALTEMPEMHQLVRRMIQLGESTGNLEHTLGTAVEFFAKEIPAAVKRTIAVLEPTIIAFSGLLVGFILLSVLMPMFSLYDSM